MKSNTDRILIGLVAALAIGLAWAVSGTLDDGIVRIGEVAPDFKVVTDSGKTLTRSDFGGKLLVLHFWATWCISCIAELPHVALANITQPQRQRAEELMLDSGVPL